MRQNTILETRRARYWAYKHLLITCAQLRLFSKNTMHFALSSLNWAYLP